MDTDDFWDFLVKNWNFWAHFPTDFYLSDDWEIKQPSQIHLVIIKASTHGLGLGTSLDRGYRTTLHQRFYGFLGNKNISRSYVLWCFSKCQKSILRQNLHRFRWYGVTRKCNSQIFEFTFLLDHFDGRNHISRSQKSSGNLQKWTFQKE